MSDDKKEIVEQVSGWSPEVVVELVSEVAWPIVVLILGWRFRNSISNAVTNFFTRNEVTELSAGATGVTAKFKVAQQSAEVKDESAPINTDLPTGMDYDSLVEKHTQQATEFSDELYENVKTHVEALGVTDANKIDLLSKELSLLQTANRFNAINKILFRSQFDLFNYMPNDGGVMPNDEIQVYFDALINNDPTALDGWDLVKYLVYPMSSGIIEYQDNGYKLTKFGIAYIKFMRSNLGLIDELAKL